MDYYKISKETFDPLYQSYESLKNSPLEKALRALIELYVSLLNGCQYCIKVHRKEALKLKNSQEKIDALLHWEGSDFFTEAEKIALGWSKAITRTEAYDRSHLEHFYSEKEIVDLTATISLMNAFNRIAIYLKGKQ